MSVTGEKEVYLSDVIRNMSNSNINAKLSTKSLILGETEPTREPTIYVEPKIK